MLSPDLFAELRSTDIVYRDDALIVLCKPAGLSTASSDGADDLVGRVKRMVARERNVDARSVYVGVHEHLERDASGLVIFTLDKRANRALAAQLEQAQVQRGFDVVTTQDQAPRRIANTTRRSVQLRSELAARRTPVIGDVNNAGPTAHRAMLHACSMSLLHPISNDSLVFEREHPATLRRPGNDVCEGFRSPERFAALVREAASKRCSIFRSQEPTSALRLIHGEADGLPGLVVDLYASWLVVHIFDDAWVTHTREVAAQLLAISGARGVYVKQHPRQKNELAEDEIAALANAHPELGEAAPDPLRITEHGAPLFVRLGDGLRTGLFLDQRDNRLRVREVAQKKRVLNLFAYTCGFSVTALVGGATHVTSVDASALVMSRIAPALDELAAHDRHRSLVGDCFEVLRDLRDRGERFDVAIVDPPSYASTNAGRFKLRRDYAALVTETVALASPGASVLCCTNHHATTDRDLRAFVEQGVERAKRRARSLRSIAGSVDFPALSGQPSELKSVWLVLE